MRWKRVAWAGCLAPVIGGGCNIAYYTTHNLINEELVKHNQKSIEHEIRSDARAAWQEVRCEFPRRLFSSEFRDGFLDGYCDYLDRGGNAQPPAVPPLKYTRHKKYFTPEGHALIKDYYLGFQYGVDVAVATGQRQFLTVPVLLPEKDANPPAFNVVPPAPLIEWPAVPKTPGGSDAPVPKTPGGSDAPIKPQPQPAPKPQPSDPPKPGTALPAPRPWNNAATPPKPAAPVDAGGTKFGPVGPPGGDPIVAPNPDLLPRPNPPLPIPVMPTMPPAPTDTGVPVPVPRPDLGVKLPDPPSEVPTLRDDLPTPPVWDDIPVIAPNHTSSLPLPSGMALPPRK